VKGATGKSLKDQNRWQLWLIIVANILLLFAVQHADALAGDNLASLDVKSLLARAASLLPVGMAVVITTVLNGLLSADLKARLVFLRWKHALPAHRAFSVYAESDPRVDAGKLKKARGNKVPVEPAEQNAIWFRFYKSVGDMPAVLQVHRDFLLMRDYAAFAAMFIVIFGATALVTAPSWRIALLYCAGLILQFGVVRQAAANYGARFVTTVLAEKTAAPARAA
jgi:hypothetical protein